MGQATLPGRFLTSPPTVTHFLHLDPFAPTSSTPGPTSSNGPLPKTNGAHAESSCRKVPVVLYDLDGTLIKTKSGNRFPSKRDDWAWWHTSVPHKLKAEWEAGKHLIVISNQGDSRTTIRTEWKAKLPLVAAKVRDAYARSSSYFLCVFASALTFPRCHPVFPFAYSPP